jgi:hypothetical protein
VDSLWGSRRAAVWNAPRYVAKFELGHGGFDEVSFMTEAVSTFEAKTFLFPFPSELRRKSLEIREDTCRDTNRTIHLAR